MTLDDLPISEYMKEYWKSIDYNPDPDIMFRIIWYEEKYNSFERLELLDKFTDDDRKYNVAGKENLTVGDLVDKYTEILESQLSILTGNIDDPESKYVYLKYITIDDDDIEKTPDSVYLTYDDAVKEKIDDDETCYIYRYKIGGDYYDGYVVIKDNKIFNWMYFNKMDDEKFIEDIVKYSSVYLPHPFNNYDIVRDTNTGEYGIIRFCGNRRSIELNYFEDNNITTVEWYDEEREFFYHNHELVYTLEKISRGDSSITIPDTVKHVHDIFNMDMSLEMLNKIK